MKHILKTKLVAFAMAAATVANVGTITANASENDAYVEAQAKAQEMENVISYLDSYVSVEENEDNVNVFVFDVPEEGKSSIDVNLLNALEMSIDAINEEAVAEDVVITDNGSVYDNSDDYILQGGNIDQFKDYWWGCKRWACRDCALDIQDGFNKISTGCWGAATAGGLITLTPATPVGVGIAIASAYDAVMYGWCATDIGKTLRNNPNSGVIITLTAVSYSVKAQ